MSSCLVHDDAIGMLGMALKDGRCGKLHAGLDLCQEPPLSSPK